MNTRFFYPSTVSVHFLNFRSRFFACSFCVSVNDCIFVLLQAPNPSAAPSVGQADPQLAVAATSQKKYGTFTRIHSNTKFHFSLSLQGFRDTISRTSVFAQANPVLAKTLPYSSKQIHGTNIDICKKSVFESFLNSLLDTAPRHNSVPCPV